MSRLLISFSGGRTSAFMTYELLKRRHLHAVDGRRRDDTIVVFANTGQEHEKTLEFVHHCDQQLGFKTIWIEAEVSAERISTGARVVTFETASRTGRPFEDVIRKYGIPNPNFLHCTRELKMNPIHNYVRQTVGWKKGSYETAIGIRADEFDRMAKNCIKERIIYPLILGGKTKQDVLSFWRSMPFDLDLPEHLGNCTWCWKKSLKKHLLLAKENPEVFDFPRRMEVLYHNAGPGEIDRPRRFFRRNMTVADIFALRGGESEIPQIELNLQSGCDETCEAQP